MRVDRSRLYLPPAVTPLAYTEAYAGWGEEARRRANQLTALAFNEGIAFFERAFSSSLLALRRELAPEDGLALELDRFLADEARHAEGWDDLNRAAEPGYYRGPGARPIVEVSPAFSRALAALAGRPRLFPLVFWLMLALEEHSLHITRCCLAEAEGVLDPTFRAAYRAHAQDEARHVRVDLALIERYYAPLPRPWRRFNALLFRSILEGLLLSPGVRARAILARLIEEHPELSSERASVERQLARLGENAAYRAMMYSPRATPLFLSALSRYGEMASIGRRFEARR